MKNLSKAITTFLFFFMAILTPLTAWSTVPQTVEEQIAMADNYREKAKEQEKIVAEHEEMKKEFAHETAGQSWKFRRFYANKIEEMDKHCDAIIANAQALADEFNDFAKWHRMRAAEMQGK